MNTLVTSPSPKGVGRPAHPGRCRTGLLMLLLVIAAALVAAALVHGMGAPGSEAAFHPPAEPPSCSGPSFDQITDWAGMDEAMGEEGGGIGEHPRRFDCGVGEAWRRHLP